MLCLCCPFAMKEAGVLSHTALTVFMSQPSQAMLFLPKWGFCWITSHLQRWACRAQTKCEKSFIRQRPNVLYKAMTSFSVMQSVTIFLSFGCWQWIVHTHSCIAKYFPLKPQLMLYEYKFKQTKISYWYLHQYKGITAATAHIQSGTQGIRHIWPKF